MLELSSDSLCAPINTQYPRLREPWSVHQRPLRGEDGLDSHVSRRTISVMTVIWVRTRLTLDVGTYSWLAYSRARR